VNTTTEPQAQAPERIYIHPTSAEWHPSRSPLAPEEYTGYVREDLSRAAADALNEIEVALISIADGVSPHDAVQKAFNVINRERLATSATSRATEGLTVEAWQPIETAPKNVDILLAWADGHQQIECLNDEPSFWFENAPTHWRNLPESPRAWAKSRAEREGERT